MLYRSDAIIATVAILIVILFILLAVYLENKKPFVVTAFVSGFLTIAFIAVKMFKFDERIDRIETRVRKELSENKINKDNNKKRDADYLERLNTLKLYNKSFINTDMKDDLLIKYGKASEEIRNMSLLQQYALFYPEEFKSNDILQEMETPKEVREEAKNALNTHMIPDLNKMVMAYIDGDNNPTFPERLYNALIDNINKNTKKSILTEVNDELAGYDYDKSDPDVAKIKSPLTLIACYIYIIDKTPLDKIYGVHHTLIGNYRSLYYEMIKNLSFEHFYGTTKLKLFMMRYGNPYNFDDKHYSDLDILKMAHPINNNKDNVWNDYVDEVITREITRTKHAIETESSKWPTEKRLLDIYL